MLRDKNLIPLSHQHQHALALCVKIDRAAPNADAVAGLNAELVEMWNNELKFHFEAEETVLFPAAAGIGLGELVGELTGEHRAIRGLAENAREKQMDAEGLREFARVLAGHVRKEERQLFEEIQQQLSKKQLTEIGRDFRKYWRVLPARVAD